MRLIDANELTELVHWDYGKPPFSRKKVLNMIDLARTIDAVPVEWIRKYTEENRLYQSDDFDLYISDMIADWMERKEE